MEKIPSKHLDNAAFNVYRNGDNKLTRGKLSSQKEPLVEYIVEDVSAVKKKVNITVDPKEVDAAIMAAVALYRTSVQIDGFRKGKVPASVIEKRFQEKLYQEAKQDLVNVHINQIMQDLEITPLSGIDFDGKDIARGEKFEYSINFEVLPSFDLPNYEGIEVVQEKAVVKPEEVDEFIERIRKDRAKLEPAVGKGPAVDGQVVEIDFATFEDGVALEGISAQNFQMNLGEGQALEAFEDLVKSTALGETKEGEVKFPDDFLAPDLAGKTVTMKVTVHAIKDRKLPELNDELAKTMGQESMEKLREAFVDSYTRSRTNLHKGATQKQLVDIVLKMVDFELPESLLENHVRSLVAERKSRVEAQGKSIESLGKNLDQLMADARPEAEEITRAQVLLMSIAKKEGLETQEQEVDMAIYQMAQRSGQDFKQLKDEYVNTGAIFTLRDRILADKAMEVMYTKAKITEIDGPAPVETKKKKK